MFHFQCINHSDVVKIINDFDSKKSTRLRQDADKNAAEMNQMYCFSYCKNDKWLHEQMWFLRQPEICWSVFLIQKERYID